MFQKKTHIYCWKIPVLNSHAHERVCSSRLQGPLSRFVRSLLEMLQASPDQLRYQFRAPWLQSYFDLTAGVGRQKAECVISTPDTALSSRKGQNLAHAIASSAQVPHLPRRNFLQTSQPKPWCWQQKEALGRDHLLLSVRVCWPDERSRRSPGSSTYAMPCSSKSG